MCLKANDEMIHRDLKAEHVFTFFLKKLKFEI